MESGLTKNQILQELTRSPHGKLEEYVPIGQKAARTEAEFYAHLIVYNQESGQIRDSKVALPVIQLSTGTNPFAENALAHIALQDPRNLVRAWHFAKSLKTPGYSLAINKVIGRYLAHREGKRGLWERAALQHRDSMKSLYALTHTKPAAWANAILFKGEYPKNSVFEAVRQLPTMDPSSAAGTILARKIPFLIALGALGAKAKDEILVMALINQMSPTELTTNMKMLERLGLKNSPVLRSAFEAKLAEAATSKKTTFKTAKAVAAVTDSKLKEKLDALQEKQIDNLGKVEGDWLVLGDKSGSMAPAIEASRIIAATLARMVKGEVHLIFFDTTPRYVKASGKTLEELKKETQHVTANGGTSIGCGLRYALDRGLNIDGIVIVSDGGENGVPWFVPGYEELTAKGGKNVPVYFYQVAGSDVDVFTPRMIQAGHDVQIFDLRSGVDFYSIPEVVKTMRANRYSLIDEIMASPLKTLDGVFQLQESG